MKKMLSIVLLGISFSGFAGQLENGEDRTTLEGLQELLFNTQQQLLGATQQALFFQRQEQINGYKQELQALRNAQGLVQDPEFLRDVVPTAIGQLAEAVKWPFGVAAGIILPYFHASDFRPKSVAICFGGFAGACASEKFSEWLDRKGQLTGAALAQRNKQATLLTAVVCAGTAGVAAGKYVLPKVMEKCLNSMAKS